MFFAYKFGPELGWWNGFHAAPPRSIVTVEGVAERAIVFGPWVKADLYWASDIRLRKDGPQITALHYTDYDAGNVKVEEGLVTYPSLRGDETGRAEIHTYRDDVARIVVTAEE